MRDALKLIAVTVVLAAAAGCATSRDVGDLRDDISHMQGKLDEIQRNQADLSAKMDGFSSGVGALTDELKETQNRMSLLSQRLDDIESVLSQRMNKLSEQVTGAPLSVAPAPSEMYRIAYGDYSRGKYDLAIAGFKSYLEKYPKGELAPQAQYYIGEALYSQSLWDKALTEYQLVEENFPGSDSVAPARLKRGLCLELLGRKREALDVFQSVAKDFPSTPESQTAQDKLKALRTNGK